MDVKVEHLDGVSVASPAGRLDYAASAPFQAQIEGLVTESSKAVLVDASALEYVSSAGLRVFLVGAKAAKSAGIGFAVCALRPAVQEVFDLTGFGKVVSIHADRETALGALGQTGT